MNITPGTHLGRYEIRSKIGAGGMGEVYRAFDPKINREVAIKVLPAAFSADEGRLSRFEQEAQAAGALNHPNILAIYDVDIHDGAPYVVSELLAGEVLRDRLRSGSLPVRKAVDYGLQMAHGLAAAHEKGIVHRDIKPENVFITTDERVKILDFGLAKLIGPINIEEAQTEVPTRKLHTNPGVVVGTVGYMSPEQVRGEKVDHRSDVFAFGAVLYEMLAGQRPFRRDTAIETLNAILKEDPPQLSGTDLNFNPALEKVVNHCLEKNPEHRFQTARDLAFALGALSETTRSTPTLIESPASALKFKREHVAWALTGLLFLTTFTSLFLYFRRAPASAYATRFLVYPPEKAWFTVFDIPYPVAVSPDGRRLALVVTTGGQTQLWLRALDSLSAEPLANTEGARNPFWSPDGRFIGFFAGGKLKKVALSGGLPSVLCDAASVTNSGTWNSEDTILFTAGPLEKGILRVSAAGGEPTEVMKPDRSHQEIYRFWPHFLPDGRHFLYLASKGRRGESALYVGSIDSKETKQLMQIDSRAMYAPPGYLLYVREGALLARPFDATSQTFAGDEITIAEHVGNFSSTGNAYFSVSANGDVLSYQSGRLVSRLIWLNRNGAEIAQVGEPAAYWQPRLSPDGKKIAVNIIDSKDGTNDIWIYDLERNTFTRFTFDPGLENGSLWSPDGRRIIYAHDRDGPPHLFQKALGDTGEGELLLPPGEAGPQHPHDWSPDGQFLIYQEVRSDTGIDLFILPMSGERKPRPFANTRFREDQARISPDGKWVAYGSDRTGRSEIYVQSFQGNGEQVQISNGGGVQPRWRRDGRELFYVSGQKLMAVTVESGDKFKAGTPAALFSLDAIEYDVSADGQRFLVRTTAGAPPLPLSVFTGWSASLKH